VIHPGRVRGLGAPKRTEKEIAEAIEKHLTENGFDQMDATLQKIRSRIKKYNLG
jgi:hypothetical protein